MDKPNVIYRWNRLFIENNQNKEYFNSFTQRALRTQYNNGTTRTIFNAKGVQIELENPIIKIEVGKDHTHKESVNLDYQKTIEKNYLRPLKLINNITARNIIRRHYNAEKILYLKQKEKRELDELKKRGIKYYLTKGSYQELGNAKYNKLKKIKENSELLFQKKLEELRIEGFKIGVSFFDKKNNSAVEGAYRTEFTKVERSIHLVMDKLPEKIVNPYINNVEKVERRHHFTMSDYKCNYGYQYI